MRELLVQGFVGQDAQVSQTKDGKPIARFSIAFTDGRDNEQVTTWYRITAFGTMSQDGGYVYKTAANLKKGDYVLLRGSYKTRLYNSEIQHEVSASIVVQLPRPTKAQSSAPF